MKLKKIIVITIMVLALSGLVFAESNSWFYPELDWFSIESAGNVVVPEGLTEREEEIYRAGFANGHYDALNPAFVEGLYVLNTKTKKFHLSNCMTTLTIESDHRKHTFETPEEIMAKGYKPCGQCNPERQTDHEED